MGVNSLPKTVTRQRRNCDLNAGPSAPESSTLTTWLPSHPSFVVIPLIWMCYFPSAGTCGQYNFALNKSHQSISQSVNWSTIYWYMAARRLDNCGCWLTLVVLYCGCKTVAYSISSYEMVFFCCRMSYQDFVKNYQKMEICNLSADSLTDASTSKKRWEMTASDGCWKKRVNAGGCRNYLGM